MKEFVEKLIERLEEKKTEAIDKWDGVASHKAYSKTIEIVNQLAEEYNSSKSSGLPEPYKPEEKKRKPETNFYTERFNRVL